MNTNRIKIVHVTSAHRDGDVRIFQKECVSLAEAGFEVYHLVPNSTSRIEKGVQVISFPFEFNSRFKRMFFLVKEVYKRALAIDADVYHLHDPELLRIATKLKAKGKIVIYDAHEDVPRDILTKEYIPKSIRGIISRRFERFENKVASRIDGVIAATPFIRDRFLKLNRHSLDINNYPMLSEIDFDESSQVRSNQVCYIGVINRLRGSLEMIDAAEKTERVKLMLAGEFRDGSRSLLETRPGWKNCVELGHVNRQEAMKLKRESLAGLVIFHPVPNHIDAQPNKIFEYMAAGLPVIGSNFPLWKSIIEHGNCGICVNPLSADEISAAILRLASDPDLVRKMGENGRALVKQTYNWEIEKAKLVNFYKTLIAGRK